MVYEPYVYKLECECYSLVIECETPAAPEDDPLRSKHVMLYILINNCCVDSKNLCMLIVYMQQDANFKNAKLN
jgi:hypothetical protein